MRVFLEMEQKILFFLSLKTHWPAHTEKWSKLWVFILFFFSFELGFFSCSLIKPSVWDSFQERESEELVREVRESEGGGRIEGETC